MKKIFASALFLSAMALVACGDDSSTGTEPEQQAPASSAVVNPDTNLSSEAALPASSDSGEPATLSSATVPPTPESSADAGQITPVPFDLATEVAKDQPYVLASATNSFIDIKTFYQGLAAGEKRILILRHGRRNKDDSGLEAHLTEAGVEEAKGVGAKVAGTDPFFYGFSDYTRAKESATYIAEGRGETLSEANSINLSALNGGWYVKDSEAYSAYETEFTSSSVGVSSYEYIAAWVYEDKYADAVYNLAERSVELLVDKVIPSVPAAYNFAVFISHDQLLVPLIAYCTNKTMGFYDSNTWLHYLSGIGIIIAADGSRKYVPVEGMDW